MEWLSDLLERIFDGFGILTRFVEGSVAWITLAGWLNNRFHISTGLKRFLGRLRRRLK